MTDSAVGLRANVQSFRVSGRVKVWVVRRLPVELGDLVHRAEVGNWVSMAFQTPRHRKLLVLVDNFHLVNSTVANHTADPRIYVGRMVEVDKVREVVDASP